MQEQTLFIEALEIADPAERAAFLDRACGTDLALRDRIEKLLQRHQQDDSFLKNPALAPGATGEFTPDPAGKPAPAGPPEGPGTVIGPYKLLQQIGEGGMGTVYMADQTQPVRRRVALKIIKPGMDSRQVIARFEAERHALALMDHPNIARVLDAGTTETGRPYFVMELVKGVPITKFCDDCRLTPRARLELFLQVCQAVQHAHQKGIIHRDLKPSNVLVALYDDRPVPKVIDFGIAKATGPKLTDRTMFTEFGQVVGTLEYMSPEQAGLNQLDIDTRSDIYSLGVLLYELLTGSTPLEKKRLREAGMLEVLRLIREEDPPKPSTRLSTTDEIPSVAAKRGLEPKSLSGLVRGDLDWIVMKSLEKDRNRRYATANGFAQDIQRYLADEPVQACPPSAGYRVRKFVRRHKGKLAVAAAMLALLLAGMVVSIWQAVRATHAEHETSDALIQVRSEQTRTRAALTAETAAQTLTREALDSLTDDVVERMFARQPQLDESEKAFLRKILGFYEAFTKRLGQTAEARWLRAKGYYQVAYLRALLGEQNQAEADYRQAVTLLVGLANDSADDPKYRVKLGHLYHNLGILQTDLGKEAEGETSFRQSVAVQKKLRDDDPKSLPYQRDLAATYTDLAVVLKEMQKVEDAKAANGQAIDLLEKLAAAAGAEPAVRQGLARARSNQGQLLRLRGQYPQAEKLYQQALAVQQELVKEFPTVARGRRDLADSFNGLAIVLAEMRKETEAEKAFREALALRKKLAEDFPNVLQYRQELAGSYHDLGYLLHRQRKAEDAGASYLQAVDLRKKIVAETGRAPRYRKELARTHDNLGILHLSANQLKKAASALGDALTIRKELAAEFTEDPEYQNDLAAALGKLATVHNQSREFAAALTLLEQARPHNQAALKAGPKNPAYRLCQRNNLQTLAGSYFGLADHARLATTADEIGRFDHDPAKDAYLAACMLCTSFFLAAKDTRLSEGKGMEVSQGYANRALAQLQRAVERGFQDANLLKMNPDFLPLKGRPAFDQLLADLEKKIKQ